MLATGQLIAASLWLALVTPFAGLQPVHLSPTPTLSMLVLGIVGTGVAYVLNYRIITTDGPTVAASVMYLLPVVSIVLGIAFLAEPAAWSLLLGTMIVLVGVALVRRGARPLPRSVLSKALFVGA